MFDYCAMNTLSRSILWTMWLLSMGQIVYVACEDVKLYYSIQSDGIWCFVRIHDCRDNK